MEKKRISLEMPLELLKLIDEQAKKNCISRSAYIKNAVMIYIEERQTISAMTMFQKMMTEKISPDNTLLS